MGRDLAYALRTLRRSPGFVVVAVLSLGLGLGLTTTMFGLLDAVRHPYAPFARADALFSVYWRWDIRNIRISQLEMFNQVKNNTDVFDAVVPISTFFDMIQEDQGSQQMLAAQVPPELFSVLGVRPELGRVFGAADEAEDVVVISHDLWKRVFRGRGSLSGLHLTLRGRTYAVIGVMPRGMKYPYQTVAWIPLPEAMRNTGRIGGAPLVRLKPGVSKELAEAQLALLARRMDALYTEEKNPFSIRLATVRDDPLKLRDIHYAMLGGAVFVLLIACANLANLMLARGLNARRDLALRLAVGATRTAVVRQMFVECAIVDVAGGALGALLSLWGSQILATSIPRDLQWIGILEPELSWRVFAYSAVAVAASAIIFGLLPAVRVVSNVSLDEPLKEGSASATMRVRHRYSSLVIVEVALALALMMGAGLLTKVVHRLVTMEYSFAARTLHRAWAYIPFDTAQHQSIEQMRTMLQQLRADVLSRAARMPGAVAAATEGSGSNPGGSISGERTTDSVHQFNTMGFPVVSEGYIQTMGFTVIAGRDFLEGDTHGSGVAILNEVAARILYPRGDAVGHMVKLGSAPSAAPWVPIVGVVRTGPMRMQWTKEWVEDARIFVARNPWGTANQVAANRSMNLLVRSERDDPGFAIRVQRVLSDAGWRVYGGVTPYLAVEMAEIRTRKFLASLFATMASFALGLAAVGLYGVLAYAVTRRMRQFGVRVAVGAQRRDIVRLIAHDSTVMVLAGTAVGGFLALGTSFILEAYLIGVYPTDAWTLVVSELVLFSAAALASLNPALRAMRADPLEILRAI